MKTAVVDGPAIRAHTSAIDRRIDYKKLYQYLHIEQKCKAVWYIDMKKSSREAFYKLLSSFGYIVITVPEVANVEQRRILEPILGFMIGFGVCMFDKVMILSGRSSIAYMKRFFVKYTQVLPATAELVFMYFKEAASSHLVDEEIVDLSEYLMKERNHAIQ